MKVLFIYLMLLACVVYAQINIDPPNFGPRTTLGTIENDDIDEASGIASSYKNMGILWTHNDAGGENRIFAIDSNGISRGTYYLNGIENRDWEDIAVGPGPIEDKSYIYIADIGDNDELFEIKYIYRIEEPDVSITQSNSNKIIQNISTIAFIYPDGKRDAETLMIDPITKDLYILSKKETKTKLYRLSYPQNTSSVFQAELASEINFPLDPDDDKPQNYIRSGSISLGGSEILVKSLSNIYYWYREAGKTIAETMAITPILVAYIEETQGEAIGWKNYDDNGYYTLSEEKIDVGDSTYSFPAVLYYYPRQVIATTVEPVTIQNNFNLSQNFPNPFNPSTIIKYSVPTGWDKSFNCLLKVYDIFGRQVAILVNEKQQPGNYKVKFDGSKLSSGIYYYTLTMGNFVNTKKMVLLK